MNREETGSWLDGHLMVNRNIPDSSIWKLISVPVPGGQGAAGEAVNFGSFLRVKNTSLPGASRAQKQEFKKALREEPGESAPATAGLVKRMRGFME